MTLAQAPRFSGGSTVARCRHKCRNGAISPLVRPAIAPRGGLAGPGPGSLQLPSMSLSSIVARASWKASADRGWRELWERDPTAHSVVETLRQDLSALVQSDDGTSSGGVAPAEWARPFVDDPDALPAALVSLTDILGLDTPLRTVELVRSRPEILSISLSEVVERVLRCGYLGNHTADDTRRSIGGDRLPSRTTVLRCSVHC